MTDDIYDFDHNLKKQTGFFFSPSKLRFYRGENKIAYVTADSWPEDAIEITAEQFKTYAQSAPPAGKTRGADIDGCQYGLTSQLSSRLSKRKSQSFAQNTAKILLN